MDGMLPEVPISKMTDEELVDEFGSAKRHAPDSFQAMLMREELVKRLKSARQTAEPAKIPAPVAVSLKRRKRKA